MDMKDISPDVDPQETREWLDALEAVLEREGPERAHYLLERLIDKAARFSPREPPSRIFSTRGRTRSCSAP